MNPTIKSYKLTYKLRQANLNPMWAPYDFQSYACKNSNLWFSKLCQHIRLRIGCLLDVQNFLQQIFVHLYTVCLVLSHGLCNTSIPRLKGSYCTLIVEYILAAHHSFPGVLQVTTGMCYSLSLHLRSRNSSYYYTLVYSLIYLSRRKKLCPRQNYDLFNLVSSWMLELWKLVYIELAT